MLVLGLQTAKPLVMSKLLAGANPKAAGHETGGSPGLTGVGEEWMIPRATAGVCQGWISFAPASMSRWFCSQRLHRPKASSRRSEASSFESSASVV